MERPASVVKELVENSVDAGAKNITIEIENGGLNLIRITDDGFGMNRADATLSVAQHATSKIGSEEDLYKIKTLGFRGEALASICSVSDFSLTTKDFDSIAGTLVENKNNQIQISDIGCPVGTSISVKNLFYNVPARLKYLKTTVTEFNHIVDLFLNYCLAFPAISWKLLHNNKIVYHFPAATLDQRIADVLGEEISGQLLSVDNELSGISLNGYIGKPQIGRNNRHLQYLFVNGRPVNEFIIAKQIKDSYLTLLPRDIYPVYILNLKVDNEKVDVNVHPRKLEVRFSEPQIVYRSVYQIITGVLDENDLIKQMVTTGASAGGGQFNSMNYGTAEKPSRSHSPAYGTASFGAKKFEPLKNILDFKKQEIFTKPLPVETANQQVNFLPPVATVSEQPIEHVEPERPTPMPFRIVGQVHDCYIVVETSNGLKIYDQHATSERVQYEKIKRQRAIGHLPSQKLLLPQSIELTTTESAALDANQGLFERFGFEVANFGANSFKVEAVPPFLANENLKEIILEIVGSLVAQEIIPEEISAPAPVEDIFKMMACKSAIKFNEPLRVEEMEALINALEDLDSRYTCAHGRPCVVEFSSGELAKMFKRT